MKTTLPDDALLNRYGAGWNRPGEPPYTDCFEVQVQRRVSLAEFVQAFYTSWLFKLERIILSRFLDRPSTDDEARAVARGETQRFAAWTVEDRVPNQLLMCDMHGRTRSWFMVEPGAEQPDSTALRFGSAVLPVEKRDGGQGMGLAYRLLLGFHKLYSRALLALARSRLG